MEYSNFIDAWVAGELIYYTLDLWTTTRHPYDATYLEGKFILKRNCEEVLSQNITFGYNHSGYLSRATVTLDTQLTKNLSGTYLAQIQFKEASGNINTPKQGIIKIYNNFDSEVKK
ncbi:MAG: hypothetical protein LBM16_01795 [Clostridiales bacterium]|nr:hypothetical protein [Clostridiales bacterium]